MTLQFVPVSGVSSSTVGLPLFGCEVLFLLLLVDLWPDIGHAGTGETLLGISWGPWCTRKEENIGAV